MSETTAPTPGPALPLFFHRVVGLNPDQHGALKLDRGTGYGFAARAASIPIGLGEFAIASRFYPIVFASSAVPAPVALVGLNELGNLFVDSAGGWRTDCYVPAYVRAFPFVIIGDPAGGPAHVGIEEGAASLAGPGGEPLFEGGKPTAVASEAVKLAAATRDALAGASAFARALDAAGLLREEEATVTFKAGGTSRVRGFRLAAQDRLDALPDDTFLDWRRRGWLAPIYAHLHSAANWSRLVDLAAERHPGR
jgi:hypothetical protein